MSPDPARRLRRSRTGGVVAVLFCSALLIVLGDLCKWPGSSRLAHAHSRSTSYSTWAIDDRQAVAKATVKLRLSLLDSDALARQLAEPPGDGAAPDRLPGSISSAQLAERLTRGLRLATARAACAQVQNSFVQVQAPTGFVAYEWRVRCPAADDDDNDNEYDNADTLHMADDLLFDIAPGHVHFASVVWRRPDTTPQRLDVVFTDGHRRAALTTSAQLSDHRSFRRFVRMGVEHIISGWDHLLFVLALMLAAHGLKQLALVATGFTLGHSITLVLSATGQLTADMVSVEALIGLSIALVAVDGVWLTRSRHTTGVPIAIIGALSACAGLALAGTFVRVSPVALIGLAVFVACYFPLLARARHPQRLRGGVAALFGLIHGFGFAGALAPLSTETPLWPLAGFNLGVEVGQLFAIALAWPVLWLARRALGHHRVVTWGSAVAVAAGVAVFTSRAV